MKNLKFGLVICDNIIYSFNYNVIDQNKGISCTTMTIGEENLRDTYIKAKKYVLNGQIENELNENFSVELKNEILKDKNNILSILRDYVQCVSMTFHGVRIVDKRINVSSFLKNYAFKNKEYREDIKVAFKVFDGIQSINKDVKSTVAIKEELKKIPDSRSIIDGFSYILNYYDISIDMVSNKEFYKQLIKELKQDNILDFLPDEI